MIWRRIWIAVAQVQSSAGLVSPEQLEDLKANAHNLDLKRSYEIEAEIGHDLVAELKTFAEQSPLGSDILHWGLTSEDIKDNAEVIRQRTALGILIRETRALLLAFAEKIEEFSDLVVMGYTHLQPAEPTTLGYRLSMYAQDLIHCFDTLVRAHANLKGKGIRGAVGTAAPFVELFEETEMDAGSFESDVMNLLGISSHQISSQTYPRMQDYWLLTTLSGLAAALHKFAFDLRIQQAPSFKTLSEPFSDQQVGSSAMPFKRNPVGAEKVCSLARIVSASTVVAWDNASNALLERTLDDSANRRSTIPEAFLASDEMLTTCSSIITNLAIDREGISSTLDFYGPFSATERLLSALVRAGANRQEMHETVRGHSMRAWEILERGEPNPLVESLCTDTAILAFIQPTRIRELMTIESYVGLAPERARKIAKVIMSKFPPSSPDGEASADDDAPSEGEVPPEGGE
jgi:adenylosuccinate lyase